MGFKISKALIAWNLIVKVIPLSRKNNKGMMSMILVLLVLLMILAKNLQKILLKNKRLNRKKKRIKMNKIYLIIMNNITQIIKMTLVALIISVEINKVG